MPDGVPAHYEHHRSEQTTLYHLMLQHAASFFAEAEAAAGAEIEWLAAEGAVGA